VTERPMTRACPACDSCNVYERAVALPENRWRCVDCSSEFADAVHRFKRPMGKASPRYPKEPADD